ncbi:MAG TPA: dephospho-CoA kinase [Planctomycetaceae bacterium]|nr:dephospho-CoA kinase [Planctomycetaceae bacterium]
MTKSFLFASASFISNSRPSSSVCFSIGHLPLPKDTSPPVVGIVGGIGSGKSSIVRSITDLPLTVIDADGAGHELLKNPEIKKQIVEEFGESILTNQEIDRSLLADRVFGPDEAHARSLSALNQILHPAIRKEILRQIQNAGDSAAIILDAALLLEGNWADDCDAIIYIDTPLAIRQQRVKVNRGWSEEELSRREKRQWDLQKKRNAADFMVDNSSTPAKSAEEMKEILTRIIRSN